jgi:dATP pyrophosphohydrolase
MVETQTPPYRRPEQVLIYLYRCTPSGEFEYLLFHRLPRAGSIWQAVSGAAHWDEELVEAARREVFEETGITGLHGLTAVGDFSFPLGHKPWMNYPPGVTHIHNTVFAAEIRNETVALSEEHDDCQWFGYQEAKRLLHWPEDRETLERLHTCLTGGADNT